MISIRIKVPTRYPVFVTWTLIVVNDLVTSCNPVLLARGLRCFCRASR